MTEYPPTVSPAREAELLTQRESEDARNELMMSLMKDAVNYGGSCCEWRISHGEITSFCWIAMSKALGNFDPKLYRGNFFRYAKSYIRAEIRREWRARNPVEYGGRIPEANPTSGDEEHIDVLPEPPVSMGVTEPEMDLIHLHERWELVRPLLATLTESERRVLVLREESGFTLAQIGNMMGCTMQNVRLTWLRALRKVRCKLMTKKLYWELQ